MFYLREAEVRRSPMQTLKGHQTAQLIKQYLFCLLPKNKFCLVEFTFAKLTVINSINSVNYLLLMLIAQTWLITHYPY